MQFKQIATFLIALPALAQACAYYHQCLCANSDGSYDDSATTSVCVGEGTLLQTDHEGHKYCQTTEGSAFGISFNNCRWREKCNGFGSTGDSNCWGKI